MNSRLLRSTNLVSKCLILYLIHTSLWFLEQTSQRVTWVAAKCQTYFMFLASGRKLSVKGRFNNRPLSFFKAEGVGCVANFVHTTDLRKRNCVQNDRLSSSKVQIINQNKLDRTSYSLFGKPETTYEMRAYAMSVWKENYIIQMLQEL